MQCDSEAVSACMRESLEAREWTYTPGVFRDRFVSPFEQYRARIGQRFTVLECIESTDPEVQDLYRIRFEDGAMIEAWPEEVCVADVNPHLDNL